MHGFSVVCLRLFNVYGPRQSLGNPYTGVLAIFASRLLAGERPVVYEDGRQTRDFVSVHDVIDAILAALQPGAADGQVVNVGSGAPRAVGDVARTLARLLGRADLGPEITGQFRRGDVRHCTADLARARRLLGFAPRVRFEAGVAELVAWARSADRVDRFHQADRELRDHGLHRDVGRKLHSGGCAGTMLDRTSVRGVSEINANAYPASSSRAMLR